MDVRLIENSPAARRMLKLIATAEARLAKIQKQSVAQGQMSWRDSLNSTDQVRISATFPGRVILSEMHLDLANKTRSINYDFDLRDVKLRDE